MAMSNKTKQRILGPFLFLVGIALIFGGISDMTEAGRLKAEGVEVPGRITDGRVKSGRRNSQTYFVTVQYEAEGAPQQKEFEVSKALYTKGEADPAVTVRHLAADPKVAQLVGEEKTGIGLLLIGIGVLIGGAFLSYVGFKKDDPAARSFATGPGPGSFQVPKV